MRRLILIFPLLFSLSLMVCWQLIATEQILHRNVSILAKKSPVKNLPAKTDFGIVDANPTSTLSEVIAQSDIVIVTTMLTMSKLDAEQKQRQFNVESIKKGNESDLSGLKIKTSVVDPKLNSAHYLIFGKFAESPEDKPDSTTLEWSTAYPISESGLKALDQIIRLDETVKVSSVTDGAAEIDRQVQRMKHFWKSLQHPDDLIAANAHLEFAITSDIALAKFRPQMKREKLIEWLKSKSTPVRRQELYLAMLAKCGKPSDGDWIAPRLTKLVREQKRASMTELTSWIACYLSVKGDAGQELDSELFLDDSSNFKNTYDAVAAIRHVTYQAQPSVSKTASIAMFRSLLNDPKLADLVVMDLARLEDWESTARLVKMFKESVAKGDDSDAWIRLPIVNFLRLNPSMVSEDYLKELKLLDPKTFKKAEVLVADPESSIDAYRVRPERPSNFRFL